MTVRLNTRLQNVTLSFALSPCWTEGSCGGVLELMNPFGSGSFAPWHQRAAMVVAAALSCYAEQPTPDNGDLEQDLREVFDKGRALEEARRLPDILRVLLAASEHDDELQAIVNRMHAEKRRPLLTVLKLAQLRGEIGMDVDLEVFVSMLIGPFVLKRLVLREEITPELREAVIRTAVTALRATAAAPAAAV